MHVVEYGSKNQEVFLLLHGGGLSWWNYREAAELLQGQFHVVLPILDGHGDSDCAFQTIEDTAAELIQYIGQNFGGQVLLLGGLSLGGQIAVEMLSQAPGICRYAVLESAMVIPSRLTHAMIRPTLGCSYGLIRRRWFSKLQFRALHMKPALFAEYYRDSCRMTKESLVAVLEANTAFVPKESLRTVPVKTLILAGGREQRKVLASARLLREILPNSRLEVLPGYRHGDLSINHPERYAMMLRQLTETDNIGRYT